MCIDQFIENLADRHNIAEEYEERETVTEIYEAVKTLSEPLKAVVILHYFNQFSISEIAGILGCREGTIKSRLFKARKVLAKKFGKKVADDSVDDNVNFRKECSFNA